MRKPYIQLNNICINTKNVIVKTKQGKTLPSICILCGEKSETILFKKKTQKRGNNWLFQIFFGNFFLYLFFGLSYRSKVSVKLPICFTCKKEHHSLQPQKVDYMKGLMEFEVHPKFKEELDKFRKSRYIRYNQIL